MSGRQRTRCVVVCADDFGAAPHIDAAILQLAQRGSISAISSFADGGATSEATLALRRLPTAVSVGLHLNLTEALGEVPARSLVSWLLKSSVPGALDTRWLQAEIERQCTRFEERIGRAPDFIDGHEHVHQFRGVRDCLLAAVVLRYCIRVAVRATTPAVWRGAKAALISALGGRALARELRIRNIAANRDFAGVYDFSTRISYALRMAGWLDDLADHGLLMCHPQLPAAGASSPAREAEFAYLSSPAWDNLRREQRIALVPFGSPFPP